ncbi:hypothetical protein NEF87_002270 [Candidatus Lokiarchaeum ossiferum]|uniref:Uncharacterized protein n=1 Tax=Candidatus Lokiarchaeum ossiferum TaxID=2951803 RepID=A0ABY6HR46_9ARCH|nr:hypothetical protein NEF87_002270 [Candidatus Lokiarchaeum sp. B-35]
MTNTNLEYIQINSNLSMWINHFSDEIQNYYPISSSETSYGEIPDIIPPFKQIQDQLWSKYHVHYQIFNPTMILNLEQIRWALYHSNKTFSTNANISNNEGVEFLLYLAQERQIKLAFEKVGVSAPAKFTDIISLGELLFGDPIQLPKAVEMLQNIHKKTKFSGIPYIPETKWGLFVQHYDIPVNQILTTLKSYNCTNEILHANDLPIDFTQIQQHITKPELEKAIIDIYNHGLISLYLTNMKGLALSQT